MSDANALVKQAVEAYKAQNKAKAKDLLLKAVDIDKDNEQAWMWMSAVVDSLNEQQVCLENALRLNPNNDRAKKGLEIVNQKLAVIKPATPSPSDSIPTSVDWASSNAPAAYGSGQQVDLPDSQQLDNWIDGLGIGNKAASGASADPWASLGTPAASDDPWASLDTGNLSSVSSSDIDNLWATPAASAEPSPSTPPAYEPPADPWASIDTGGGTVDPSKPSIWDEPAPTPTTSVNPFTTVDWDKSEVDNYDPFRSSDPWEASSQSAAPPSTPASNDPFRSGGDGWGTPAASPPPPAAGDPFGVGKSGATESWGSVNTASPSSSYSPPPAAPSYYEDEEEDDFQSGGFDFDDDDSSVSASSYGGSSYGSPSYGGNFDFGSDDDDLFGEDDLSDIDEFDEFADDDDPSRYYAYIPNELHEIPQRGSSVGMILMVLVLIILNVAAGAALVLA